MGLSLMEKRWSLWSIGDLMGLSLMEKRWSLSSIGDLMGSMVSVKTDTKPNINTNLMCELT